MVGVLIIDDCSVVLDGEDSVVVFCSGVDEAFTVVVLRGEELPVVSVDSVVETSVVVLCSVVEEAFVVEELSVVFVNTVVATSGNFVVGTPFSHFTRSALSHFIFSALYNMFEGHLASIFFP